MALAFSLANGDDHERVGHLFHDLLRHYWGDGAPPLDATVDHVRRDVLSDGSCEVALAELDGELVGLATFAVVYPAPHLGGQLFMKDLYTTAAARGRGVGEALMRFIARLAVERGCVRFDWTAERYNERAVDLYRRLGAAELDVKIYFRLDGEALEAFAGDG